MRRTRLPLASLISFLLVAGSGCSWLSDVSSTMRVDTGLNPENIDNNVRFRTTYYFRVLTGCRIDPSSSNEYAYTNNLAKRINGHFSPLNDSLYRFRMTGQAAALFNRVHFESGVLRKQQIDPFGSAVRYSDQTNSFIPVSAEELRADARIDAAKRDIEEFRSLYMKIQTTDRQRMPDASKETLLRKLIQLMEERLDFIRQSLPPNTQPSSATRAIAAQDKSQEQLQKLTTQLEALTGTLNKAEVSLQAATSNLQNSQKEVDRITREIAETEKNLESTPSESEEAKKKIQGLSKQLDAAKEKLVAAKRELEEAQTQIAELNASIAKTESQIKAAGDDLNSAKRNALTPLKELYSKAEKLLAALGAVASTPENAVYCNGKPTLSKYYLLGPEGTKELDPEDRLLLALSVDSKPLISALQKLSAQRAESSGVAMKNMEQVMEERGRILDARDVLRKAAEDAAAESGPTDKSQLKKLIEGLRTPFATTNASPVN